MYGPCMAAKNFFWCNLWVNTSEIYYPTHIKYSSALIFAIFASFSLFLYKCYNRGKPKQLKEKYLIAWPT